MSKFKIGDAVIRNAVNPDMSYYFDNKNNTKPGDIVVITAVRNDVYSVEGAYIKVPNWSYMEETFDLFTTWKNRYEGGKDANNM